jgi:5-methyltetrahydropteroyltriglutamate--homocysteine methyltransferase
VKHGFSRRVGSLPRSPRLTELLLLRNAARRSTRRTARQAETAVETVVRKPETGIDIGNDGEQPRVAFHTYVARMRGFGGGWIRPVRRDVTEASGFAAYASGSRVLAPAAEPQAVAEVEYADCRTLSRNVRSSCVYRGQPRQFTERWRRLSVSPPLWAMRTTTLTSAMCLPSPNRCKRNTS